MSNAEEFYAGVDKNLLHSLPKSSPKAVQKLLAEKTILSSNLTISLINIVYNICKTRAITLKPSQKPVFLKFVRQIREIEEENVSIERAADIFFQYPILALFLISCVLGNGGRK